MDLASPDSNKKYEKQSGDRAYLSTEYAVSCIFQVGLQEKPGQYLVNLSVRLNQAIKNLLSCGWDSFFARGW